MLVPHARQRTVLPRAELGTASTFLHVSFGHIIRTVSSGIPSTSGVGVGIGLIQGPLYTAGNLDSSYRLFACASSDPGWWLNREHTRISY